uniref:Calcium/calmodulin-dependent protein kinase kinase 1 (Trinotate prediction) n=1 Tax=Henneguya salminicola TaxID=69463 RepID=A0A6G3MF14_HENSL
MIIPTTETYNEVEVLFYFHDTINGLKYLHQNKIPHLDIKPTNLLLASDNRIKIADFGLSIIFDENFFSFYTVTGSIGFCAPELLSQNNNDFKLESLYISDIWSLGLTLYCLLYGNLPWLHEDITQVINDIINNE